MCFGPMDLNLQIDFVIIHNGCNAIGVPEEASNTGRVVS